LRKGSRGDELPFRLDNVSFKSIIREDNEMLVRIVSEVEVKVVWNCDSSKSPVADDFNFGFIKFS